MSKHTQGPWHLNIDTVHIREGVDVQPVKHHMDVQGMADARLIAAAPELLEALQLMLEQFTKIPSTLKDSEARGKAHAAIAKATGEAV